METRFCCASFISPLCMPCRFWLFWCAAWLFICLFAACDCLWGWECFSLDRHTLMSAKVFSLWEKCSLFPPRYLLSFAATAVFLWSNERKFTAKMIVFSVNTVLFFFSSFIWLCNWLHCCCRSALINFSHTALEATRKSKKTLPMLWHTAWRIKWKKKQQQTCKLAKRIVNLFIFFLRNVQIPGIFIPRKRNNNKKNEKEKQAHYKAQWRSVSHT